VTLSPTRRIEGVPSRPNSYRVGARDTVEALQPRKQCYSARRQDVYPCAGVILIRSQHVTLEGLILKDVAFIPEMIHETMPRSEIFPPDVLLSITGASIGRCCPMLIDPGRANMNNTYAFFVFQVRRLQMRRSCR